MPAAAGAGRPHRRQDTSKSEQSLSGKTPRECDESKDGPIPPRLLLFLLATGTKGIVASTLYAWCRGSRQHGGDTERLTGHCICLLNFVSRAFRHPPRPSVSAGFSFWGGLGGDTYQGLPALDVLTVRHNVVFEQESVKPRKVIRSVFLFAFFCTSIDGHDYELHLGARTLLASGSSTA